MNIKYIFSVVIFLLSTIQVRSQITDIFENFEGNSNIPEWVGDDCGIDLDFDNPYKEGVNTSSQVLRYDDVGGQYANVRFQLSENFDLTENNIFSLKIYVPSNGITGDQQNQVSLKLQDGLLAEPWTTQSEIVKPIAVNEWQTVTFNFKRDNFRNFDPTSIAPTLRSDFNRVVIQVNGENNNDSVTAYIDDIELEGEVDYDDVYTELIWSDEFDSENLDAEKWFRQTLIPNGESWFNGEVQHYTAKEDNAKVEDGLLKIVAKKESHTQDGVTKQYTSARLNSKFAFTYGKVEVRAKLPYGAGTWPAIWMLGKNIIETGAYWQTQGYGEEYWPACGEIDIMEHWGDNQNYVSSAIHTPSSFGGTVNVGGVVLPGVSDDFHTYKMIWSEDYLEFFIDDVFHYRYDPSDKNDETWPFYQDQYLLFNVAILPSISPSFTEGAMEIDYVRIYQSEQTTNTVEHDITREDVVVFPSPFENKINIEVGNTNQKVVDVLITDVLGRVHKVCTGSVQDGLLQVEGLDKLTSATYVVSFILDGKTYSLKVVK